MRKCFDFICILLVENNSYKVSMPRWFFDKLMKTNKIMTFGWINDGFSMVKLGKDSPCSRIDWRPC